MTMNIMWFRAGHSTCKYALTASLVLLLTISQPGHAEELADPASLGISAQRLQRVDDLARRYVEEGRVMGMVTMITRHGQLVQSSVLGTMGMDNDAPMQGDALFRIYSMTKAVTAVAALILYEEGHFQLYDPVEKFLPEFAGMQVLEDGELRPARTKMTMHHLFTHMSGLTYNLPGRDELSNSTDTASFIRKLAEQPLAFDPGEGWEYGYSQDVLGAVVEKISGQSLGEFMRERIFKPLGMHDTFFEVPADKLDRLTTNHGWDYENNRMQIMSGRPFKSPYRVSAFDAGGGGLISTAGDYVKFLEMLRLEGRSGDGWILGPKTVKFLFKDHLPRTITDANIGPDHDRNLGIGGGHGLGIGVYIDPIRRGVLSSKGELDWGGIAGTVYWLDPVEDVIVVGMIQLFASPWRFRDDLSVGIYQSLTTSLE